jgi:hypothetical protein
MKRLGLALVLLAATGGAALAASPFDGTWKLNTEKSNFTGDTFTYTATANGFHYSDGAAVEYDFAIDGKAYPTLPGRTVTWTKTGDNSWESVTRVGEKTLGKARRTLSADGKTLTIAYTTNRPDGTTAHEEDVYARVSGTDGLAGDWKSVKAQTTSSTMIITTPAPGKFEINNPAMKQVIKGSVDGPAVATGPFIPPGAAATYKAPSPNEWDYAVTLSGKPFIGGMMTVSPDGKTLTDASWTAGKESEKSTAVFDKQ